MNATKEIAADACPAELAVRLVLRGIDQDEAEHEGGWWPTSDGVEMGAKKLAEVVAIVRGLNSQLEHAQAALRPRATALDSIALMRAVMQADEAMVGRCLRGTTNWAAAIGRAVQDAVLAAQAPQQAAPDGWREGVEAVAKMLTKKADDYAAEYGHDDMGGLSFGSGDLANDRLDYHSNLLELAAEVRAMPAPTTTPTITHLPPDDTEGGST